jgi:hypothetical protein
MTVLVSILAAILHFLQFGGALQPAYVDPDDPRDKKNQAPFHEEQMFSPGRSGHCPHG